MKEVKLTEKDLLDIKSSSIKKWVDYNRGETTLVQAVIESFIAHCNCKDYIVTKGKIFMKNEIHD